MGGFLPLDICNLLRNCSKPEMEAIGENLEMSVKQVCVVLKEHNLLYLTKSSVGYQARVKFKGESDNYYCVKKNFGNPIIPEYKPTTLEDGAKVMHDGTVKMPVTLYQQLFGGNTPCVVSDGSSKSSKKGNTMMMWDNDL